jgi:hypothetical protein
MERKRGGEGLAIYYELHTDEEGKVPAQGRHRATT